MQAVEHAYHQPQPEKCRELALLFVNRYDNILLLEDVDIFSPQAHFLVSLVKAA